MAAHTDPWAEAVSRFGATVTAKFGGGATAGAAEDQLRGPLESLFADLAPTLQLDTLEVVLKGESSLTELKVRPDYAVERKNALIGFIEVKAPGKGADPRRFSDPHDSAQWEKLKALPNLIYTDGNAISLWRDGKREGEIVYFFGDVRSSGAAFAAPAGLVRLLTDFLNWSPEAPRSPKQLAQISARLCRLLRDEVIEQLEAGAEGLTSLKADWRKLLFPEADDAHFADGYAQAVTFGLLMAKARGISLADGLDDAARTLRHSSALIGTALRLLTDEAEEDQVLKTSLSTLTRVLDVVDWAKISKGQPEAWLYFYEEFLDVYDKALRKETGSYYTPPEVVKTMVRLTDEALKSPALFGQVEGLASPDVTIADPAVGTGTFLLGVLHRIAETVAADEGAGSVPGRIASSLKRMIGFELQFGPFAVGQLRLLAEIADLTKRGPKDAIAAPLRLYVADTLANPNEEVEHVVAAMRPITDSRREANRIRREEPITVVIGNPPYKEKAKGRGEWVETALLDAWKPPTAWGAGEHAKHLRNLYVYFWRWAAWKVFGGEPDLESQAGEAPRERQGIVCFITVAGFLNGPGFQKMRADLRRDCDAIWVIDCSPERHQPPVPTRIFQGVQQPVCIVLAARRAGPRLESGARVRFRELPMGAREGKFASLADIGLEDGGWAEASREGRASFLPEAADLWASFEPLDAMFTYEGSGVMPGRTWVIAPDKASLEKRWDTLVKEKDAAKKAMLFHPHMRKNSEGKEIPGDKHAAKIVKEGLSGHPYRPISVAEDVGAVIPPQRYGFRSFDRQWIIPDARLLNQPNPTLWKAHSDKQIYATALSKTAPRGGPAVTFTALIPDMDHYNNRGGRVLPLWADASGTKSNIAPALLDRLELAYGRPVSGEEVFAYLAAVAAHPAYTVRFAQDLKQPGLRIPLTASLALFEEAVVLGREVVWLHTFGERWAEGRMPGPPNVEGGPTQPADDKLTEGEIERRAKAPAMPNEIEYSEAQRRLWLGSVIVDNVDPAVRAYEVSGKNVLDQWFGYRRADRAKPTMGDRRPPSPLQAEQPRTWPSEYTTELLRMLRVLTRLVSLEPAQSSLLDRILSGAMLETALEPPK